MNLSTNECMLKFVIVAPSQRGKGNGKEMLQLAIMRLINLRQTPFRLMFFQKTQGQKSVMKVLDL